MPPDRSTRDAAEALLAFGIMVAEGKADDVPKVAYRRAHESLSSDPIARSAAPTWLMRASTPQILWAHLRSKATGSGSWAIRRDEMHDGITPVLDALAEQPSPVDEPVVVALGRLGSDQVTDAWRRALVRRESDPEAAITAARSMLESVLKTILDDRNVSYDDGLELPKLFKLIQGELGLAPNEQTEAQFRAVLGASATIVQGIGSIRNKVSDAHGRGRNSYRAGSRHAGLVVNLAGAMAVFLVETAEQRASQDS